MDKTTEDKLISMGALDKDGFIIRPKVRKAWDRIWNLNNQPLSVSGTQANKLAEDFLLMLARYAEDHDLTFNEACEKLGY